MGDQESFALIIGVAVAVGVVLLVAVLRHAGRRRVERLAPAFELGTCRTRGPFGTSMTGLYRGFSCRYTVEQRSQYTPGGADLRVAITAAAEWAAEVAGPGSRMMVKVGLLDDVAIGDSALDEKLRFSESPAGTLVGVFGTEDARSAMQALAASGNFHRVRIRHDRVEVRWQPRARELDEDPDGLRLRLELVVALIGACGYPPSSQAA